MRAALALLIALGVAPPPLGAQSSADSLAVRLLAIRYMQEERYPRDTLILDPEDLELRDPDGRSHGVGMMGRSRGDRMRSDTVNRTLEQATGLALGSTRDVVVCGAGTRGTPECAITGGSGVVAMSEPSFDVDSARLYVRIMKPYRRGGMFVEVVALTLRRGADAWVIGRARTIFIT